MSVANIMPGDRIVVELSYTELLVPEAGVYEFVYPTVVGPRYSNQKASQTPPDEHWVENPYLTEGKLPTYTFALEININAGIPIQDIASPSHKIEVHYDGESRASISLDTGESTGGNRDYVLRYRLQGEEIESGLLLYEGQDENFFLLMVQPPKQVLPEHVPPREYIFVVDVSGSMYGFPLTVSKRLMRDLLQSLRPQDTFNIILFAGGSTLLSESSLPVTPENIRQAIYTIDNQHGGGGTELLPALRTAVALPTRETVSRSIVVVTDGYISADVKAIDFIRSNLSNANVFAFGIGSSVNRYLIEGLARAGYGEPFVVLQEKEAAKQANKFRAYIDRPVLTNISTKFDKFEAYDVEPQSIPDVMANRPVILFGKWKGDPLGTIRVHGLSGKNEYTKEFDVADSNTSSENSALRFLWARTRIATLGDYQKLDAASKYAEAITALGLKYSLLTKYTSFVAVDEVVRNSTGTIKKVKQPLPLPKGVSNKAVGGFGVPTTPEPDMYLLILLAALLLLMARKLPQNLKNSLNAQDVSR